MSNNTTASHTRAPHPRLRGDNHPTHSTMINMLEHAIELIERGDIDEGRKILAFAVGMRGAS